MDEAGTVTFARCGSCGRAIVWIATARGEAMPADPDVIVTVDDDGVLRRGRVSHFATCPDAAAWSGQSRADRAQAETAPVQARLFPETESGRAAEPWRWAH